jgi:phosphate transport system permease protein
MATSLLPSPAISSPSLKDKIGIRKRLRRIFRQIRREVVFRQVLVIASLLLVVLMLGILLTLITQSIPSIRLLGLKFIWGSTWNPVKNVYGAWPFLLGTLLSSFVALLIAIPFSVGVAIFLGEYYPNGWLADLLKNAIELIAAVPSVIYGFWGLAVLVPIVRGLEGRFGIEQPLGVGIFSASLILSIMIIPYAASLGRSMIQMVPYHLKEAAYGLGATRWEVIRHVVIPYTRSGLFAGILLSLGRALGETMAVTMVIGNTSILPKNLFAPGNTMASVIANEFTEADKTVYLSALIELGLALFLVTVIINITGKKIIDRLTND